MDRDDGTFQGYAGISLYYQQWFSDTRPRAVLALVHGFAEHSGRYGNVVNYFVPRGYAIYAPDLRGHGRSPGPHACINSWEEYREDVRALLHLIGEQMPGIPLFLWGHSMGGLIVLDYALHYADGLQGVIASAPSLSRPKVASILIALNKLLSEFVPRLALETGLDARALSRDIAVAEAYRRDPLVDTKCTARLGAEMLRIGEETLERAADLRVPTLILHGSADRLIDPAGSRAFSARMAFPDKEYREYEGGYHELHNDTIREQVLADVERWLERHLITP